MDILFCAYARPGAGDGVAKKIRGQMAALERLGHTVARFSLEEDALYLVAGRERQRLLEAKKGPMGEYLAVEKGLRMVAEQTLFPARLCYTRRIFCTPWHLAALRAMKANGVCCVEELPTYPYDEETKAFKNPAYRAVAFLERRSRVHYKEVLDYFVTTSGETEIFGVPAIHIENGVDVDAIRFVERKFAKKDEIHLVAVSAMAPWHGYERLIEGIAAYEQGAPEVHVRLDMVGEGACRQAWEKLAVAKRVADRVRFHGYRTGKELDALFAKADIAVSTLGWYKKGVSLGSELKNREYMARGIPFVYSAQEAMFSPAEGFCMLVPDGPQPVDVAGIVAFYQQLRVQKNVSRRLRWFAEKYFRWDTWMNKVVETALPDGG